MGENMELSAGLLAMLAGGDFARTDAVNTDNVQLSQYERQGEHYVRLVVRHSGETYELVLQGVQVGDLKAPGMVFLAR